MIKTTKTKGVILLLLCMTAVTSCKNRTETAVTEPVVVTEAPVQVTEQETESVTESDMETKVETDADTGADTEAEIQTITGEVLDAAMNTVVIKTDDGQELIFGKEDAETDFKDGLLIGNYIMIEYTGEIDGTDTSGTRVIKITDAERN